MGVRANERVLACRCGFWQFRPHSVNESWPNMAETSVGAFSCITTTSLFVRDFMSFVVQISDFFVRGLFDPIPILISYSDVVDW